LVEELWFKIGNLPCVAHAVWPNCEESMLVDDEIEIFVPKDAGGKSMEARSAKNLRAVRYGLIQSLVGTTIGRLWCRGVFFVFLFPGARGKKERRKR